MKSRQSKNGKRGSETGRRSLDRLVRCLCRRIVDEAVEKGYADFLSPNWNPDAHVEITLTIKELRVAGAVARFRATEEQLKAAKQAQSWREYLMELDGVE